MRISKARESFRNRLNQDIGRARYVPHDIVQAQPILTVSESKRLIAQAVKEMPIVKNALANGMVIIGKGTTNAYVAEEITGRKIERAAFVRGRIQPAKGVRNSPM